MSDEPKCGNCRYWLSDGMGAICRRFPPYVFLIPASTLDMPRTISIFPGMGATGWCGEHRPKPEGVVIPIPVSLPDIPVKGTA